MSELKIEKERVLKAAKSCPDVQRVLKTLFPEAFEEELQVNITTFGNWNVYETEHAIAIQNCHDTENAFIFPKNCNGWFYTVKKGHKDKLHLSSGSEESTNQIDQQTGADAKIMRECRVLRDKLAR